METIELQLPSAPAAASSRAALCGVVSSGDLEVLFDRGTDPGLCTIAIHTSAHGFTATWQAVLEDFAQHHPAGGLRIAINDMGATPAVVALRLSQGLATYLGGRG